MYHDRTPLARGRLLLRVLLALVLAAAQNCSISQPSDR